MYFHCCREGLWHLFVFFFSSLYSGSVQSPKKLLASKNYLRNLLSLSRKRLEVVWESQFGDTTLMPGYCVLYKYRWWAKLNLSLFLFFLVLANINRLGLLFASVDTRATQQKSCLKNTLASKIHFPTHQQGHDDGIVWLWWWTAQVDDV